MRKDRKWEWRKYQQIAFGESKQVFLEDIFVNFPGYNKLSHITIDASSIAIGIELFQFDEKKTIMK